MVHCFDQSVTCILESSVNRTLLLQIHLLEAYIRASGSDPSLGTQRAGDGRQEFDV